jgi:hypothetical protein
MRKKSMFMWSEVHVLLNIVFLGVRISVMLGATPKD